MGKLEDLEKLFAGRQFDCEVVILCVRWYLRFSDPPTQDLPSLHNVSRPGYDTPLSHM